MAQGIVLVLKKNLKKFVRLVAPLGWHIPAGLRHKLSGFFTAITRPRQFKKPQAYNPGQFPKGINLFGLLKAEIGLAQGAKLYASAIEEAQIPHCFLNTDFLDWLPQKDSTFDTRLSNRADYAVNVIHINPDQWEEACAFFPQSHFDNHYNIGVWLWELETIPHEWKKCLSYVDELWAPSKFIAEALRKEAIVPVTVIPYGISVPYNENLSRKDLGLPEDRFLVLTMYDSNSYASRKNPGASMRAFCEAFQGLESCATLVIKVNNPKTEDIDFIRDAMGKNNYILIEERMDKTSLNALIRMCDVFISLHRSEGFGLVMAEAMALGCPVIATNWSANTEFMDEESACMVDYELIPVNGGYQYNQPEHRWADANVHQAAAYLRRLFEEPEYRRQKAEAGYHKITSEFSVEITAQKMRQRLDQII